MGLADTFSNWLKGSSNGPEPEIWGDAGSPDKIDEIFLASNEKTQVILKHSYRCGTSFFAKKGLETEGLWEHIEADLWLIDVVGNRKVSDYLAEKSGIVHESPQLVVIRDGTVIWHGSHGAVSRKNVEQVLSTKS